MFETRPAQPNLAQLSPLITIPTIVSSTIVSTTVHLLRTATLLVVVSATAATTVPATVSIIVVATPIAVFVAPTRRTSRVTASSSSSAIVPAVVTTRWWRSAPRSAAATAIVPTTSRRASPVGRSIASAAKVVSPTPAVVVVRGTAAAPISRAEIVPASSALVAITIVAVSTTASTVVSSVSSSASSSSSATAVVVAVALAGNVLDRQHALFESASVGGVLGLGRLVDGGELNECVVAFHIDSHQFPEWFEQHLQIFSFGSFLLKVHHKKSIRRLNVLATIVLLALDPSISPGTLGTKSRRDIVNSHSTDGRNVALRIVLVGRGLCVFQKDKAIPTLLVQTIDGDGLEGVRIRFRRSEQIEGFVEDGNDVLGLVIGFQIPQEDRSHRGTTDAASFHR
mmetsp:Transcript_27783/g.58246  ORF Transcript_27783/g.58246 Transcript_27783/m.58246 type:complete len:397 (-) Transcript_27783:322-1512(-)